MSVFTDLRDLIRSALHLQEYSYYQASPPLLPEEEDRLQHPTTPPPSSSRRVEGQIFRFDMVSEQEVARVMSKQILLDHNNNRHDSNRNHNSNRRLPTTRNLHHLSAAAALNSRGESPTPDDPLTSSTRPPVARRDMCRYCRLRPVDTFFLPCGHRAACGECAAIAEQCVSCGRYICAKFPFTRT